MLIACKSWKQNKSLVKRKEEKGSGAATELIPERRMRNSPVYFRCLLLYIWFSGIIRVGVCPQNYIVCYSVGVATNCWAWKFREKRVEHNFQLLLNQYNEDRCVVYRKSSHMSIEHPSKTLKDS